ASSSACLPRSFVLICVLSLSSLSRNCSTHLILPYINRLLFVPIPRIIPTYCIYVPLILEAPVYVFPKFLVTDIVYLGKVFSFFFEVFKLFLFSCSVSPLKRVSIVFGGIKFHR